MQNINKKFTCILISKTNSKNNINTFILTNDYQKTFNTGIGMYVNIMITEKLYETVLGNTLNAEMKYKY